ncbi:MAG: ABC transporter permease [Clostridia bacterium]|nr:ABC transporter permease [Clostridia bacterium]
MLKKYSGHPYILWSMIFIVFPLILVIYYSLVKVSSETGRLMFSIEGYKTFMQPLYLKVFIKSVLLALEATALCLVIGYPIAYIIANMKPELQKFMALLLILPMWMNFLLRTYAWISILGKNGIINRFLGVIGLPALDLMFNDKAVLIGMVYNFLPFMVLPIYTVLSKIDKSVIEAAQDLGANSRIVMRKVVVPLSIPGIISGITMVFMPAVSTFVIPSLLGGGRSVLIGNLVEQQFLVVGNWNFGSAISVVLMIFILMSMRIMKRYDVEEEGEMNLW